MRLKFEAPTPQTPGFLRRLTRAFAFSEKVQAGRFDAELINDLTDFLADFITEPKDKKAAKEALLDATQEQFTNMLNAVMGVATEAVPLPSEKE